MRNDLLAGPDPQALRRGHHASGENDLEGPPDADQPGQAYGAPVDERHAPAPAVHAEVGVLLHDPDVAPERQLHAAGDRGSGHRRDDGLGQLEPGRPHRAARGRPPVARKVEIRHRSRPVEQAGEPEVPARAKGPALAPEDGHVRAGVGVEGQKGRHEGVGARGVHSVPSFWPGVDDRDDRPVPLDANRHGLLRIPRPYDSAAFALARSR